MNGTTPTPEAPTGVRVIREDIRAIDDLDADGDLLVVTAFADEQPLKGLAGLIDWRLRGKLSRQIQAGFVNAAWKQRLLCPTSGLLPHERVLLLGLGASTEHRTDRAIEAAKQAASVARDLGANALTCALFGLGRLPSPVARTIQALIDAIHEEPTITRITLITEDGHWPGARLAHEQPQR
jgi:hypothetical protein